MLSDEQREERLKKMEQILEHMYTCRSIDQISASTGIPTSTIQRYLNKPELYMELVERGFIKRENLKSTLEFTKGWLQNSKRIGTIRGGETSQRNHGYVKDKKGKFRGSGGR